MIPPLTYVLPEVFGLEMCFQQHNMLLNDPRNLTGALQAAECL